MGNKEDITFIVHSEWLECLEPLTLEKQDKVIADIIRYGTGYEPCHSDDPDIVVMVNLVKNRIDFSKDKYAQKVEAGQKAGRKKSVDNMQIWKLAHDEHKKSAEIAIILGCSKSTVDHSEGWAHRHEDDYFSF